MTSQRSARPGSTSRHSSMSRATLPASLYAGKKQERYGSFPKSRRIVDSLLQVPRAREAVREPLRSAAVTTRIPLSPVGLAAVRRFVWWLDTSSGLGAMFVVAFVLRVL